MKGNNFLLFLSDDRELHRTRELKYIEKKKHASFCRKELKSLPTIKCKGKGLLTWKKI